MKGISFIGAGNMAYAIVNGYIRNNAPETIGVYDISEERLKIFADMGCRVVSDYEKAVEFAKYIVLCVKPQTIEAVLDGIKDYITDEKVIISIVAGVSAEYIQKKIGFECKVVRTMPNTPLLIGYGATAISDTGNLAEEEYETAQELFKSAGKTAKIPSELMNEVVALNGSSPAYIYLFAKVFVDKAQEMGINREAARELFCETLIGSAKMMLESGKSEEELIKMVCSPGGTTLSGLEELKKNNFENTVEKCIEACVKRAYEIGR